MEVNFQATKELLNLALRNKTQKFIYSSTAAVYGSGIQDRGVKEDDPKNPESPYGKSKLMAEMEVQKFLEIPENRGTSLRFFNVVGAANFHLQDNSVGNLIPILLRRIQKGLPAIVFGNDYPTRDGTCVRDYVDVRDISRCHFAVSEIKRRLPFAMNVGTGKGLTVSEVIEIVQQEYGGSNLKVHVKSRRQGDPATLFADTKLIRSEIDFEPQYSLKQAIACISGYKQ
jgi:UDP-glucose 4-epimerase